MMNHNLLSLATSQVGNAALRHENRRVESDQHTTSVAAFGLVHLANTARSQTHISTIAAIAVPFACWAWHENGLVDQAIGMSSAAAAWPAPPANNNNKRPAQPKTTTTHRTTAQITNQAQ